MKNKTKFNISIFPIFFIFLILKLCGIITWSWWWVTCPLWLGFAIILFFAGLVFGTVLALFPVVLINEYLKFKDK